MNEGKGFQPAMMLNPETKKKILDKRKQKSEMTTTADAGIPHDTKDMGPKFTTTNVMDRRKKKNPALLKRFTEFLRKGEK